MRADRLVAILLLLQRRGQVTAAEVAAELEVSERTARRDLDALGMAGIPIYSVQGRGGGWRLAGGGTTDLSGLTEAEARALFLLAGTSAVATPEVQAALRKLLRALPEPLRDRAEAAGNAVVVDPTGWGRRAGRAEPPHLPAAREAVIDARRVHLGYTARDGAITERVVDPLGVAAKAGTWYLLGDTEAGRRLFRIDRITALETTDEPAQRPPGFDLAAAWQEAVGEIDQMRAPLVASGRARPEIVGHLAASLGTRCTIGTADPDGWVPVELRGHTVHTFAAEIAGYGERLDVLDPPELRDRLAEVGAELVARYG